MPNPTGSDHPNQELSRPATPTTTTHQPSKHDLETTNQPPTLIQSPRKSSASSHPAVPESLLHRLAGPSSTKAGLIRDPDEVAKIIYENSKGSKFFLNEQAKDARMTAQLEQLLKKLDRLLAIRRGNLAFEEQEANRLFEALESIRVLDQAIVCVDADAFYCSVEEKHDPSLKGKAFAVGSGVLTTASYEARKWGCRSAMAGYIATKLCPHLKFVEPDFSKYTAASESIMAILRRYDPNLAPASLDECFMNLTTYCNEHNLSSAEAATKMRQEILDQTGLTVSAGIGPNAMIAKIAADLNKPNGQFVCPSTREGAMSFMKDLPVRKVPGIGRVTERWLDAMGVKKCGDIWEQRAKLLLMRSEVGLDLLMRAYLGLGKTDIQPSQRENRQSVGCESSFKSLTNKDDFFAKLKHLSAELAQDLSRLGFAGRTLTLKIKLDTFEVLSRSVTPAVLGQRLLSSADDLYHHGTLLLEREIDTRHLAFDRGQPVPGCGGKRELSIRLLGLKVSQLQDQQQSLTPRTNALEKWIAQPTAKAKANVRSEPSISQGDSKDRWRCPICECELPKLDLRGLNEHLDLCLWKNSEEGGGGQNALIEGSLKRGLDEGSSKNAFEVQGSSSKKKPRTILDWCGEKKSK